MEEVIRIICRECKGKCCRGFPVYFEGFDGRLYQNILTGKLHNAGLLMNTKYLSKVDKTYIADPPYRLPCFYYLRGGCPPAVKPAHCHQWICKDIARILKGEDLVQEENVWVADWEDLAVLRQYRRRGPRGA